jgi:Cu-processing system ATP-binding protein
MIWVKNLTKSFGDLDVLKDVSMTLREGGITAVVGPNASGKTTMVKCILGLVRPDAGEIYFEDEPVLREWRYRSKIGYMPQLAKFPENLTVRELFSLLEDVRSGGKGAPERERDRELYDRFDLESIAGRRLGTLSGGTRQKINAAMAFLFSPLVLILDEPTVGLDPRSALVFKDKVRAARDTGGTVVLITHLAGEIGELADHVVYMLEGRPHFDGPVDALLEKTSESDLERAIARMLEETDGSTRDEDPEIRNS